MDAPNAFIYGLVDPRDGRLRYVGKSIRPFERRTNHMNEHGKCHRSNWLRTLRLNGLVPKLVVLDVVPGGSDWQSVEIAWIAWAKSLGCDLVNNTSGGDGVPSLPPEARERIRRAWLGRKHKPETLAKLKGQRLGAHHTEEHKAKMRALMTNRTITWGATIAASVRKLTQSQCDDIRARIERGARVKDIAHEFGLHRTTVSKVKCGTYFVVMPPAEGTLFGSEAAQ